MKTPEQNEPANNDPLQQRSRELFDTSVANQDARTRSRLNQARQAALDVARGSATATPMRWLVPVGSAAALGLVVLTSVQFMRSGNETPVMEQPNAVASTVDDLEILTSSDELEMLQDVDFYAWLETQQEGAVGGANTSEAG